MLFTAYACLAISTEYFVLSKTSFHTLTASELTTAVGTNEIGSVWKLYMGLRGIAISSSSIGQQQNGIGYNQLCDLTSTASSGGENVEGILLNPYECDSCSDNLMSMNVVISIMISVATFFPTFFSQQLRMFSGYDVNCVKVYLTLLGTTTILLNLNVILSYYFLCFEPSMLDDDASSATITNIITDPITKKQYEYDWKWGWGLIILVAGTCLKFIDVVCNVIVPTPNVTRDRKEQEIYETIVDNYCASAVDAADHDA